jgi:hypothetical protein
MEEERKAAGISSVQSGKQPTTRTTTKDDDEGKAPWLQLLSAEARHEPESVIHSGWSLPLKRGFEHDNEHDFKRSRTFEEAA